MEELAERLRRLSNAAKASSATAAADREARNTAISEADDAGWKLREISKACELALSHTQRIVVELTARRQDALELPEND